MKENEQTHYKEVPGFPKYEVNKIGQIRRIGATSNLMTSTNNAGYKQVTIEGKSLRCHRAVALAWIGIPEDPNSVVNHKNPNKKNNHVDNLEWVSNRENVSAGFLLKNKSSKYIGVCWNKNRSKWVAGAKVDGKKKFLGYHLTEELARQAYLNFISGEGITNKYTKNPTRFELIINKIKSLWK